ncbi:MAG: HAD family hydrolase [Chloroflexi bacterium]|nr:HAD family hydrolase [Chloroflexota bacterium]
MYGVTLDLWRTLIDERPGDPGGRPPSSAQVRGARVSGVVDVLRSADVEVERAAVEQAMAKMREAFDRDHNAGLDVTFERRVRQLVGFISTALAEAIGPETFARIVDAVDAPFLSFPPEPLPGAGDALRQIRGTGASLALISNTGFTSAATYRRWMDRLGWLDLFDVTTFSNEVAVAKPTADVFRQTVEAMEVRPCDALHAGDSLIHDVAGAKAAGLSAVWIRRSPATVSAVRPDYVVESIAELPEIVERWLTSVSAR